jgi:hypothetical protein
MAKTDKLIEHIDDVIEAYGGREKFAQAFGYPDRATMLQHWRHGIPSGAGLGLYMGLLARGCEPTPKLFGLKSWEDLVGVGHVTKRRAKPCGDVI